MAIFEAMKNNLRNGIALSLIPQIMLVQWLALHPHWVENYYSNGIYPVLSKFFRTLYGWIPFSVGELIYSTLIILAIRYLMINWKKIKGNKLIFVRDTLMVLSVLYFTFNLTWGLNYYREPLAERLAIKNEASFDSIKALAEKLIIRTNALQFKITRDSSAMVKVPYTKKEIFDKTIDSYADLESQMPYLGYPIPNIKNSMYSIISSYMGIGGYLNPFTNEAQVNSKTPMFRFPVVSGHEIGHQVGYSAENETNFIGYLVTLKNKDPYFQYSATSYALSHCLNALGRDDEQLAKTLYAQLNEGVRKNYKELQDFQEAYENPIEPIFKSIFSAFLKANNQVDGIQSYGKAVNLIVGYHEKHPL